jgi:plasmid stabilization system protein ParE
MQVRWSETALTEIDHIFAYIFERNRSSAVAKRLEERSTSLAEFPLMGHRTDEAEVRVFSVVRYPFLIFYAIDDATNEISSCMCDIRRKIGRRMCSRVGSEYHPMFSRPAYR